MADGIFSAFEREELNKITAKSILEKLMNIRQNINVEFTARRLIWELMQNAKDNASLCNKEGEKVDITVQITQNEFIFTHNKGYFTNEHIRGLIRKYSSSDKDRNAEQIGQVYKTTGRFGTGFMTTHLLSERVRIQSFYRNENQTFHKFSFWLDRSGKGEKEIIQGIDNAFNEAECSIRESSGISLTKNDFKTSFIYPLTGQKNKLAHIALKEVERGIAYTLINMPEINTVTIARESTEEIIYQIKPVNLIPYQDKNFYIYNLLVNGTESKNYYLTLKEDELQIIVPVSYKNNVYSVLETDSNIPRLHLDFPLIGTEDLNLPFIVNSPLFEPTEPRDGISLTNDEENNILQLNCKIMLRTVELYIHFLSFAGESENWNDLHNLARIKQPRKHLWIDEDWFKKNIIDPIRSKLLHTPIVDVESESGKRIAIWNENNKCQVFFPEAEKDIIREKIWDLSRKMYPQSTPQKKYIHQWAEIIWKDCYKFTVSELSEKIGNKENIEELALFLNGKQDDAIDFLNKYYVLLNMEQVHIKEIIAGRFQVIPNQLGTFKKSNQLHTDKDIEEELKNACTLISKNPREYLVHRKVNTGQGISYHTKDNTEIIQEINNIIKENKNDHISAACDYLASLFPAENIPQKRTDIFEFSKQIYPDDFTQKRALKFYDEKIWEESDKQSLFYIVAKIAGNKTTEKAWTELNFKNKETFLVWLNNLVTFLIKEGFDNNINRAEYPVLPNQNGAFHTKDNLFLDNGDIGEQLKDISGELGYDFRKELLDESVFLELPKNRVYSIKEVAEKISSLMKPVIRDVDKRKEYKATLKKFYLWMDENRTDAKTYFSDLFEKRFLFLEDEDISENMKKATELDQLIEEHGFKDIADLRAHLSPSRNEPQATINNHELSEKIDITKEILVSLGISSREELEEALKDPAISAKFYHTSTPTTDMFIYAQGLIERAKRNIIEYLKNNPEYDCSDLEETAPTTLAGITKKGLPVQIVTRPSDNGEVIIYYSSEKDTLDCDNAELWIDNGKATPHILTLGRILKSTGINRIPINLN